MEIESIDSIIRYCNKYWDSPNDERTKHFKDVLPDFLSEFKKEEKPLIISLIKRIDYYSHSIVNESLIELHRMLIEDMQFNEDSSIYCVLKEQSGRINSSHEYLAAFRLLNGISKYIVYPDIKDASGDLKYIENVILIDDYCGSGDTLINYVKKYSELLSNKKIVYAVVHAMEEAVDKIIDYSQESGIDIQMIYVFKSKRAFLTRQSDRVRFKAASIRLGIRNEKKEIWGFEKTEALVSFYNNTPNNTLGVFWKDTKKNKPLFPRENDKRPSWYSMKKDQKSRSINNYNLEVKNAR